MKAPDKAARLECLRSRLASEGVWPVRVRQYEEWLASDLDYAPGMLTDKTLRSDLAAVLKGRNAWHTARLEYLAIQNENLPVALGAVKELKADNAGSDQPPRLRMDVLQGRLDKTIDPVD